MHWCRKDRNINAIKSYLFKNTQLQISYNVNTILIKDRKPMLMPMISIFDSLISWSNLVLIKSSKFEMEKLINRKEIIEGLLKALEKIDDLISLIKTSYSKEDAIVKIKNLYFVNDRQADAIVSLRLYNLTNIDIEKLRKEHQEIILKIIDLDLIINNEGHRNNILIKMLNDKKEIYNFKRKSLIEKDIEVYEFSHLDVIDVVSRSIIITKKGYIKFVNELITNKDDIISSKYSEKDIPIFFSSVLNTLQHLFLITNRGRIISIPSYKIKTSYLKMQLGTHLNEFCTLDIDENVIFSFIGDSNFIKTKKILLASKNSFIKIVETSDFSISKNVKIQTCFKLKNNDKLIYCDFLNDIDTELVVISNNGFYIRYSLDEIPTQGRTSSGIKNIKLKNNDFVSSILPINTLDLYIYLFTNNGYRKFFQSEILFSNRYNVGKNIFTNENEKVLSINKVNNNDIINLISNNEYIQIKEDEIYKTNLISSIKNNKKIFEVSIIQDFYKKWGR